MDFVEKMEKVLPQELLNLIKSRTGYVSMKALDKARSKSYDGSDSWIWDIFFKEDNPFFSSVKHQTKQDKRTRLALISAYLPQLRQGRSCKNKSFALVLHDYEGDCQYNFWKSLRNYKYDQETNKITFLESNIHLYPMISGLTLRVKDPRNLFHWSQQHNGLQTYSLPFEKRLIEKIENRHIGGFVGRSKESKDFVGDLCTFKFDFGDGSFAAVDVNAFNFDRKFYRDMVIVYDDENGEDDWPGKHFAAPFLNPATGTIHLDPRGFRHLF